MQLEANAEARGLKLSTTQLAAVISRLRRLPPFPDVKPTLERLHRAGFRMATLTNSNADMLAEQIHYAGLEKYFEKTISVEAVRKYKPAAETYRYAAESLGVETGESADGGRASLGLDGRCRNRLCHGLRHATGAHPPTWGANASLHG